VRIIAVLLGRETVSRGSSFIAQDVVGIIRQLNGQERSQMASQKDGET